VGKESMPKGRQGQSKCWEEESRWNRQAATLYCGREEKEAQFSKERLVTFVKDKVTKELFAICFPERAVVWEHVRREHKLSEIIAKSSDRYIQPYTHNTVGARQKNSALFLMWLNEVRACDCDDLLGTVTLEVSKGTKQTMLAMISNAVYLGLCQQMAETA
jgi:hypothetical protein